MKKLYEKYVPTNVREYIDETDFEDRNSIKKELKNMPENSENLDLKGGDTNI